MDARKPPVKADGPLAARVAALLETADVRLDGGRPWDMQVHDKRLPVRLLAQGSLGLGEAYMDGWWDSADLDGLLWRLLRARLDERRPGLADAWDGLKARLLNLQSARRSFEVGRRHYDLGNDLYAAMLGRRLVYSCGYWREAGDLDAAQEAKLDLVCRKLGLRAGQCGLGGRRREDLVAAPLQCPRQGRGAIEQHGHHLCAEPHRRLRRPGRRLHRLRGGLGPILGVHTQGVRFL